MKAMPTSHSRDCFPKSFIATCSARVRTVFVFDRPLDFLCRLPLDDDSFRDDELDQSQGIDMPRLSSPILAV